MEQIKRSISDGFVDHDHTKRQKLHTTVDELHSLPREVPSCFEDLFNELMYEIFEYLNHFHVYKAFSNLNTRFRSLLIDSNLPITIDLSSMPKLAWKTYNTDIIENTMDRVHSFRACDRLMEDVALALLDKMLPFNRLEHLMLDNIECSCLEHLLSQLSSLPLLSSLTVNTVDKVRERTKVYREVFRLPALKYCKLSLQGYGWTESLPIVVNECSPIEHLIITNSIGINQLDGLLSYVPQLRRLSLNLYRADLMTTLPYRYSVSCRQATHISLELISGIKFNEFEEIIRSFPMVEVLYLTVPSSCERIYANADKWEQLITSQLHHLRIFDIHYSLFSASAVTPLSVDTLINQFSTPFWIARQWSFTHQPCESRYGQAALFYSTNPYRRNQYELHNQASHSTCCEESDSNLKSVQRINIPNEESITRCVFSFPNVTELHFDYRFKTSHTSLINLLDHIIPLKQLTKIVLKCTHFHFKKIIDLLDRAPQLNTLEFQSMPWFRDKYSSIQQTEKFQRISQTNTITHVTYSGDCTLDKLKLLLALCPRVQHISIYLERNTDESIIRFLLDRSNPNTSHLCVLCIQRYAIFWHEKLDHLLKSEQLLDDYTLKQAGSELYLWW